MQRYDAIRRPFRRLIRQSVDTATSILSQLRDAEIIGLDDLRIGLLARQIAFTITYWLNFDSLFTEQADDNESVIYDGVLQILAQVAPHLGAQQQQMMDAVLALHRNAENN